MIEKVLRKLKTDKVFLELLREKYKYIIVDEYQDTNSVQREFLKILSLRHSYLQPILLLKKSTNKKEASRMVKLYKAIR